MHVLLMVTSDVHPLRILKLTELNYSKCQTQTANIMYKICASLLFFGTLIYSHWEAMLISYLSTRVIVLPFNDIPELVSKTQYRIILRHILSSFSFI